MLEETSQAIEIRTEPNPWVYGPPLFLAAIAISTQPNILGLATALVPESVFAQSGIQPKALM